MSSLAAARADNFYYPPGWTPEQGSLNTYHGQHALRERARKLDQGILIIRFEMPFHIWCGGCEAMIAKGVRFNAEKKQIGNYHSTKIWSFKMKSACCQHEIEIHTDPKNCDYVVVSGARKKVVEYDAEDAGTTALPTEEEREKLADPLYKVEHLGEDAKRAKSKKSELVGIKAGADARHADPWRLNRMLRAELRAQKKRVADEEGESRSRGLAIRLLPGSEEDRREAALADFRPRFDDTRQDRRAAIRASSIFDGAIAQAPHGSGRLSGSAPGQNRTNGAHAPALDLRRSKSSGASRDLRTEADAPASRLLSDSKSLPRKRAQPDAGLGSQSQHRLAAQSGPSNADRRARLAAKRRRIDAQGVLQVAAGKAS